MVGYGRSAPNPLLSALTRPCAARNRGRSNVLLLGQKVLLQFSNFEIQIRRKYNRWREDVGGGQNCPAESDGSDPNPRAAGFLGRGHAGGSGRTGVLADRRSRWH